MLALVIALACVSAARFLFLGAKIATVETQLRLGQEQIETRSTALEAGADRLQAGEQKLAQGKHAYNEAKENPLLVLASNVLNGGKELTNARNRIGSTGERSPPERLPSAREKAGLMQGRRDCDKASNS